jgi:hypothetical protein
MILQYICEAQHELKFTPVENERKGNARPDSVFSKKIRAGKRRTYFFDVKSTRANDYFLTITESKKRHDDTYERFKIFLYKEDFNKFIETLQETIDHVKNELMPGFDFDAFNRREDAADHGYGHSDSNMNQTKETPVQEASSSPEEKTPAVNDQVKIHDEPPAETPQSPPVNDEDLKW